MSKRVGETREGAAVKNICVVVLMLAAAASIRGPARFWNLTKNTVSEFSLTPTGTLDWGPNQCRNDKDVRVDFDERLAISGLSPGIMTRS